MKQMVSFTVLFLILTLVLTSAFPADEYFAPHMLIPKTLYSGHGYTVSRMSKLASNYVFGWDIFCHPRSVLAYSIQGSIDRHEYLMVTDLCGNRIIASDQINDWVTDYGEFGSGVGQFRYPIGISSMGPHTFFIADADNNRIVYGRIIGDGALWDGEYTEVYNDPDCPNNHLLFPKDVDARPDDASNPALIAVADYLNHRIVIYKFPENPYGKIGGSYTKDSTNTISFIEPTSLCFGRDYGQQNLYLYVIDNGLHKILRFYVNTYHMGCPTIGYYGYYDFPENTDLISVDADNKGQIYVVERRSGKIYKFSKDLRLIATYGGIGTEDGKFYYPNGLSISHGVDCTYNPCVPISNLADAFVAEEWGDQTGVRRYILGVDVLNLSAVYRYPVVNDSDILIGGNKIEYQYYTTDYAYVTEKIFKGDQLYRTFNRGDLNPGYTYSGSWDVGGSPNGTYTVVIQAQSIYSGSNTDTDSTTVCVNKSQYNHRPVITSLYGPGDCFVRYEARTIGCTAFDPDDNTLTYKFNTWPHCHFLNGTQQIITTDTSVTLCGPNYTPKVANQLGTSSSMTQPDFWKVTVYDYNNDSACKSASFTVYNDPRDCPTPPGCPYVYAWNGQGFEKDNVILTASEDTSRTLSSVIDYYPLSLAPKLENNQYQLLIKEFENETSQLDYFGLIAFDYPTKSKIGVTTDGRIFNYSNPVPPISCIDQEGVEHLNELISEDSIYFESSKPGYLIISFGILKPLGLTKPSGEDGGGIPGDPPGKDPYCEKLSPYASSDVQGNILHIDVLSSNGQWMEVDRVYPRINPCRNLTELSQYVIPGQDFKIRLRWDKFYKIDHIAYYTFDNSYIALYSLPLSSAHHSDDGNITGPLSGIDANKGTLCPNQEISVSFLAPKEDPQKQRGFVLVTKGYYVKTEQNYSPKLSSGFQVQQNYPNPFNPVTQIKFSLPQATQVTLTIYNILGQKVITLINKEMEAGDHSIYWNGRNSAGEGVASGIYFYKLQTEDFSKTKKMLLLR